MSTNYYLRNVPCPCCGHVDEPLHIGKSSMGWCFALHVIPNEGLMRLEDWEARWKDGGIFDEYGRAITPAEMHLVITERRLDAPTWTDAALAVNQAIHGPNNLARRRVAAADSTVPSGCVGHGDGPWDLVAGYFC